ncbi:hypothetical protein ACFV2H_28675 [Streptomyces sp. NPDC059629]|uniref:hypothetical protein n=1 Tax=Streptomyces sp. NPDC059629 TaxID=3346889 RepID=UPI0036BBF812
METQVPDLDAVLLADLGRADDERTAAGLAWVIGQCDRAPVVREAGDGAPGGGAERLD